MKSHHFFYQTKNENIRISCSVPKPNHLRQVNDSNYYSCDEECIPDVLQNRLNLKEKKYAEKIEELQKEINIILANKMSNVVSKQRILRKFYIYLTMFLAATSALCIPSLVYLNKFSEQKDEHASKRDEILSAYRNESAWQDSISSSLNMTCPSADSDYWEYEYEENVEGYGLTVTLFRSLLAFCTPVALEKNLLAIMLKPLSDECAELVSACCNEVAEISSLDQKIQGLIIGSSIGLGIAFTLFILSSLMTYSSYQELVKKEKQDSVNDTNLKAKQTLIKDAQGLLSDIQEIKRYNQPRVTMQLAVLNAVQKGTSNFPFSAEIFKIITSYDGGYYGGESPVRFFVSRKPRFLADHRKKMLEHKPGVHVIHVRPRSG